MPQEVYQHTFTNGLTLLAERMEHVGSAALNFLVPAGCVYDPPDHQGIASMRTLAKNLQAPVSGWQKAKDQSQQRGFPTAVGAQHGDELPGLHGEAGVAPQCRSGHLCT